LLARGEKVRAVVRNPEKARTWKDRGAEIALADFDDAAALRDAFTGTEGVFAMLPPYFAPSPNFAESRKTIASLRQALSATPSPKAVYLSSIGAEKPSGLGLITALHLLEEQLSSLPIPTAFLRAGWFMENSAWDVSSAREGKMFSHLQPLDRKVPLVATQDIGRSAADVLLQSWTGTRYIEVAGPQKYSPIDMAECFATVLGHHVEAIAVPHENWVKTFVAQGMPEARTAPRVEMLASFNSGWIDFGAPGAERVTGTTELQTVLEKLVGHPESKTAHP
jgi:uncharacterized protein YbjT (DUF2867 family)